MKKYAKIVCGALQVPQNYPCAIEVEGKTIHNPTEEEYLAAGHLPLEECEPEEKPGKVAMAKYAVNKKKTAIVQTWEYIDEPEERVEDGEQMPTQEATQEE